MMTPILNEGDALGQRGLTLKPQTEVCAACLRLVADLDDFRLGTTSAGCGDLFCKFDVGIFER